MGRGRSGLASVPSVRRPCRRRLSSSAESDKSIAVFRRSRRRSVIAPVAVCTIIHDPSRADDAASALSSSLHALPIGFSDTVLGIAATMCTISGISLRSRRFRHASSSVAAVKRSGSDGTTVATRAFAGDVACCRHSIDTDILNETGPADDRLDQSRVDEVAIPANTAAQAMVEEKPTVAVIVHDVAGAKPAAAHLSWLAAWFL